jgi:septal ring factor EnvC (AmiA/AmiB activator)
MENASEGILALKPVTFHYKTDKANTPQFGLIAEDVAKVNPDLVVRDKDGGIYTVRYDVVNAMLLNEFLKEHKKVEKQQATIGQLKSNAAKQDATISELKKDVGVLTAQLKEQASQIQKVSAQIELDKFATGRIRRGGPAPRTVLNKP